MPMFDLINHRQPKLLDKSDHITFDFRVNQHIDDGQSSFWLAFPALAHYQPREEFSYAYSSNL